MTRTLVEPDSRTFSTYRSYQRIEHDLRQQIAAGRWPAGVAMPTRRDLAKHYGVDRNTLQRAVNALLADGTLVSNGVRGTFVANAPAVDSGDWRFESAAFDPGKTSIAKTELRRDSAVYGIISNARLAGATGHDWDFRVIHAAERTATASGSATRFTFVEDRSRPFIDAVGASIRKIVAADAIAGLIVVSLHSDDQSVAIDRLMREYRLPIVYISSVESEYPVPHVYYDQTEAGFQAARHAIDHGHTSMTFVAPAQMRWVSDRIQGARSACRLAGLPASAVTVYPPVAPTVTNRDAVFHGELSEFNDLFTSGPPTALIGCNDNIALQIMAAGERAGKVAGRDYMLIGFDDEPPSCEAGLSTLAPPLDGLGEEAARLLPRLIDGTRLGAQVRLRSHLVERSSSGAATKFDPYRSAMTTGEPT